MLTNILGNEFDDHDYIDDYGGLESLIKLAAEDDEMDVRKIFYCLPSYPFPHRSEHKQHFVYWDIWKVQQMNTQW